tara:strand:+ start:374 stop:2614 length:2241 start_codon:yes stop_codon:yes gene_type:complete
MEHTTKPPVTQKIMQRRFKGFTPQQKAMILSAKNIQDGTPEAAKELAKATSIATEEINKRFNTKRFQVGGVNINGRQQPLAPPIAQGLGNVVKDVEPLPGFKTPQVINMNESQRQALANASEIGKQIEEGKTISPATANKAIDEFYKQFPQFAPRTDSTPPPSPTPTPTPSPPVVPAPFETVPLAPATGPVDALQTTENIVRGQGTLSEAAQPQPEIITDAQVQAGEIAPTVGQIDATETGSPTVTTTQGTAAKTAVPTITPTTTIDDPQLTQQAIDAAAQADAIKGVVSAQAQVDAQTLDPQQLAALDVEAAQLDTARQIDAPDLRIVQPGEMITDIDADATRAAQFTEQVQAAQGQVSDLSTVRGQLAQLQREFEDDQIPVWATGAYRQTQQALAARGLSSSSLAGQAIVQAFMESSIPIAQADAQVFANMDLTNLSNRQQRAMLAAQQRATFIGLEFDQAFQARVTNAAKVSDIANVNFTAQQQIAIENARLAQTVDIANLNNKQAKIMADAGALSQVDLTNLNNRQQAAVQNAKSFLQMDMSNLSFEQQAAMFEAQSRVQSLFSDQAAVNAANNFNAQSENEMTRFFQGIINNTNLQNTAQQNAMEQFNVDAENSIAQFNSTLRNQREMWNAENARVIAESNKNWRREITTRNNASTNAAYQVAAQNQANLEMRAYDNLWQRNRDIMNFAYTTAATEDQYAHEILLGNLEAKSSRSKSAGMLVGALINGVFGNTNIFDKLFT